MSKDSFSFSRELEQLQEMVLEFARETPDVSESEKLAFYEDVVERTVKSLKWINSNSRSFEERTTQKLLESEKSYAELERKLERLLEKAAELRIENKELKKRVKTISVDALNMSRLMLGLKPEADKDAIKKAYRNKAKRIHPDRENGDPDLFKAITEAMVLLIAQLEMEG